MFTGKERDLEGPGLDFFHARYFHGTQGRFASPDFSPHPRATPNALRTDPQTLNLYAYVHNNPLAKVDLDGHADTALQLMTWFVSQIGPAGPKEVLKDIVVGTAKGAGKFGYDTLKAAVASTQGVPGPGLATITASTPKSLQPSNSTQAAASGATQITLTVASAAVPAALVSSGTAAASVAQLATGSTSEGTVEVGTTLFRVFGGEATPFGNLAGGSFTTADPSLVDDFRVAAGLFPGNTGRFVLEGTLTDTSGVTLTTAAPGPGGVGGTIPEVIVPDAAGKVVPGSVSGVNPPY